MMQEIASYQEIMGKKNLLGRFLLMENAGAHHEGLTFREEPRGGLAGLGGALQRGF